jgi:hypothetical protein
LITALASDVVVTWLGAVGTGLYVSFLWQRSSPTAFTRAVLFLLVCTFTILALRGFYWMSGSSALGRVVFAAASLLPLAITLVTEQLLRRHHPLLLKLVAAGATVLFQVLNLFFNLATSDALLIAFAMCLALVVLANAVLLLAADPAELAANEQRQARAVLIAALLAAPLVVTDFREQLAAIPVRLGAIGALMLVYVLLHGVDSTRVGRRLLARLVFSLAAACVLALAFGAATQGIGAPLYEATVRGLPVAHAWVLLTMIFVRIASVSSRDSGQRFLRWLLLARLESAEAFLRSLKRLPQTEEHIVLAAEDLRGYTVDLMLKLEQGRREPVSLGVARALAREGAAQDVEAAEQIVDLLERHEMTHVLVITAEPPLVVLLNLPQGIDEATGSLRAGVIQRLARRLSEGGVSRA